MEDNGEKGDRGKSTFQEDESLPVAFRAKLQDYFRSGYDRGHMYVTVNYYYYPTPTPPCFASRRDALIPPPSSLTDRKMFVIATLGYQLRMQNGHRSSAHNPIHFD